MLYQTHLDRLLPERWDRLSKDRLDPGSHAFFSYAKTDAVWNWLGDARPKDRLKFLLVRIYNGRWGEYEQSLLHKFSAKEVLEAAAATYWPIELEPIQLDGTYGWTTRAAAVNGNVAQNIIRFSVKMEDYGNVAERGEWVHLYRWQQATYLCRFKQICLNKDSMAYCEWSSAPELPFIPAKNPGGRIDIMRGYPKDAVLPIVDLTEKESLAFHLGGPREWVRGVLPINIAARLKFEPNQNPVPTIEFPAQTQPATQPSR